MNELVYKIPIDDTVGGQEIFVPLEWGGVGFARLHLGYKKPILTIEVGAWFS